MRVIEDLGRNEQPLDNSIYGQALDRLVSGELRFEKLSEAEMEALTREGYGDSDFGRPI